MQPQLIEFSGSRAAQLNSTGQTKNVSQDI
jgi:hypothetical protein